ncbi:acetyltransferase [Flavobacterium agricola]|uniref:Acetyltransferase n=1 Tax=Flavobacterium agricola TaxID=2870839 RepID=A0ABY6LW12_9FLAO|nr:acetyltransferase [Flavobacterium agricola]UYW00517.1 acetyltransferase [Flavobacterium agricola]
MLIVGAKGFAKEVLEVCHQNNDLHNLVFYDDVNKDVGNILFNRFPVLKNLSEAENYFKTIDTRFTIGIGNPNLRNELAIKFKKIGGTFSTIVANTASIGSFDVEICEGCNIMQKVVITNSVKLGIGVLVNQLTSIGHDVIIGDFVEVCPSVSISGNCVVGSNSFIGTSAVVLPNIKIGKNVTIGAGAVVTKDIPDNCVAIGIPAKILIK